MTTFGYVFADDMHGQHMQGYDLRDAGATEDYGDLGDDGDTDRPELVAALAKMTAGDTLLVTRLDRLGPTSDAVLDVLNALREKGAGLTAIDDGIVITPADYQRINHLYATLTAIEAAHQQRTAARDARKPERRRKAGRPSSLTAEQIALARRNIDSGHETIPSMAKLMKVNKTTLWRAIKARA